MRKITIVALLAFLVFPVVASNLLLPAPSLPPTDTTYHFNDKVIVVNEVNDEMSVSVFKVRDNDTINLEMVYEGVFAEDRSVERQFDNRFEISIPEVFRHKKRRNFDPHWGGFGVGFTNLPDRMDFDGELSAVITPGSSLQYNLNFGDATYSIGANNVRIVLGMGIQFNSVHLQTDKAIEVQDYKTIITTTEDGFAYNTSRLHFTYLTIPLLLEYNAPYSKGLGFFINGGVVGKIKTASSSKVWYHEDGKKRKYKMPGELNIRPVSFDFIVQAGFGNYGVFATYSPVDLFINNKGPKGSQVSIGLQYYFL